MADERGPEPTFEMDADDGGEIVVDILPDEPFPSEEEFMAALAACHPNGVFPEEEG